MKAFYNNNDYHNYPNKEDLMAFRYVEEKREDYTSPFFEKSIYLSALRPEFAINKTTTNAVRDIDRDIEKQFNELATKWKNETRKYSTMFHKALNNNYLEIIGMGTPVLPYILKDLQKKPQHWFIALKAIAKINPVAIEDIGDIAKMTEDWLNWGKKNNLI